MRVTPTIDGTVDELDNARETAFAMIHDNTLSQTAQDLFYTENLFFHQSLFIHLSITEVFMNSQALHGLNMQANQENVLEWKSETFQINLQWQDFL